MQKKILDEKERELVQSMNSTNEENWNKITELTNEKLIEKLFFFSNDYNKVKLNFF
jgi:hypothetical protein